jgi:hypothetical protein
MLVRKYEYTLGQLLGPKQVWGRKNISTRGLVERIAPVAGFSRERTELSESRVMDLIFCT